MTTVAHARRTRLLAAAVALVGALAAWRALLPAWRVPTPTRANLPEERMQDFRDALYFPIREFLDGGNPYHPAVMFAHWPVRQNFNLYQPYHLLLHAPFALPGYRVGAVAFALASLVLLLALAVLAAGRLRPHVPLALGTAVVATLLLLSQVGKAQLYVGQVNPLIAVGAAGALLARDRHPRWAAVALALAWLKPQFGLPLALLLFARGSRRVALTGTAVAAVASLVVLAPLVVRDGVGSFLDAVAANLEHAGATAYGAVDSMTAQRVDVAAVVHRVTGWLPPGAEGLVLVGVLLVSAVLARRLDRAGAVEVADLLTCLAVVVCVVHQPGDVLIAVPSAAAVAALWWRGRDRWLGWALLAVAVPFAHLHFVGTAVRDVLGPRVDVTVDGVALVAAWVLVVVAARSART
ncbi:glycosyltransferase 87 family protein [Saccharothrix longispora]|uniref:glycosyltransferase 87 family protein n=1 Tax=Saccharothrix longispora TaxID=33920 RepID=UPI0028FD62FD|nr:glycosyltransferase 87 family protein [Saccharothrix longispora]MDU0290951.1 glycosyltransferase 87 family protein [Saccharothrix longispora]